MVREARHLDARRHQDRDREFDAGRVSREGQPRERATSDLPRPRQPPWARAPALPRRGEVVRGHRPVAVPHRGRGGHRAHGAARHDLLGLQGSAPDRARASSLGARSLLRQASDSRVGVAAGALRRARTHCLAERGVDAIIGHHPHVVQPVEHYRTRRDPQRVVPIYYSLGNLINPCTARFLCHSRVARLALAKGTCSDGTVRTYVSRAESEDVLQVADESRRTVFLKQLGPLP
ncbi:MAG: CapA family protein [Polyangiaceae bacterium]|nr:CapA family protein [Polyangiaceae bacterium]